MDHGVIREQPGDSSNQKFAKLSREPLFLLLQDMSLTSDLFSFNLFFLAFTSL